MLNMNIKKLKLKEVSNNLIIVIWKRKYNQSLP